MENTENLTSLPKRRLPEVVELDPAAGLPPHSPRETALLEEQSGKSFEELGNSVSNGERLLVWFTLRRMGYEPTWDEAADVLIRYVTANPPEPAT